MILVGKVVEGVFDGVRYLELGKLEQFAEKNYVDIVIVSRYVHFFMQFFIPCRQIYMWLHDVALVPYWYGKTLPRWGESLLHNVYHQLSGIVFVGDWQKRNFIQHSGISPDKMYVVGNGMEHKRFNSSVRRRSSCVDSPECRPSPRHDINLLQLTL